MTNASDRTLLSRLGSGEPIRSICDAEGISEDEFKTWWQTQAGRRVSEVSGTLSAQLHERAEIVRDPCGIPHVLAENDEDLFVGLGVAMAQDRLWQLDYLRRKALGRLAEVLGPEALEQDRLVRTVGIHRIAQRELDTLPDETRRLLDAFCRGVNVVMEQSAGRLPIEFGLLDYEPEPWSARDSVAIWGEFRWYLTGRLQVIAIPELARRVLGDEKLFEAFLTPEAGEESILPRGTYPAKRAGHEPVGTSGCDAEETLGSNNWVVAASRSSSGSPLVASDPHIAFGAVSIWYEVQLSGGSFETTGMAYPGVPAVLFGRNRRVAWGITNNICSQRDLYQEKTNDDHPGCFLYDGDWEPARKVTETIAIKGSEPLQETIRSSRNGPVVDKVLPEVARGTGPVSLRWLGATRCDELSVLLALDRVKSCDELRACLKGWRVPTLSFVFADVEGDIGYQCSGRIPVRENWQRGYRPGWEPDHQWQGLIPYDSMPALDNPEQSFVCTANNRVAPDDFPYPLSGTWSSGHRARRIRQMIESREKLSPDDFRTMQGDTLSLRAGEGVRALVELLGPTADGQSNTALRVLGAWNGRMDPDQVGATLFEVFFRRWCETVAAARFSVDLAPTTAESCSGLALSLLAEDRAGWFSNASREEQIRTTFGRTLEELTRRLGSQIETWTWGRLHTMTLRHALSSRGDLGQLLDRGNYAVGGHGYTVCNTASGPDFEATTGAAYRMITDLADPAATLWAVDAAGQSGHPGSDHYCDQQATWVEGGYHALPLDREKVRSQAESILRLIP